MQRTVYSSEVAAIARYLPAWRSLPPFGYHVIKGYAGDEPLTAATCSPQ